MEKTIFIVIAGTGDTKEPLPVQITPGIKPRDVLTQLKLVGFQLEKPEGGVFGLNDDLYAAVTDGQKVFASKANVVAGR